MIFRDHRCNFHDYLIHGPNLSFKQNLHHTEHNCGVQQQQHSCRPCMHFEIMKTWNHQATDACLTAIPGVASSIRARSHTFVEIDHEIISTVILLPSADLFKKGCCQLQAKVCARITGYPLVQACPGKSVVRWTDRPAMTIAVDLGRKATKQTNKQTSSQKTCRLTPNYFTKFNGFSMIIQVFFKFHDFSCMELF